MKKWLMLSISLFVTSFSYGGEDFAIWDVFGDEPPNSVLVLPAGTHIFDLDLEDFMFVGLNYKSYMASTFTNSYGDRTYYLAVKRNWINNDTYSLGYAMGLIYGYDGRLADIEKIPFRNTFLFNGPVSPLGGMFASYHLNEGFSLNFSVQPLVILYGFEVRF